MLHDKIVQTVHLACEMCAAVDLAPKIRVSWSQRFTARMGDARWDPVRQRGLIRLSGPLWPRASPGQQCETIIHETCHIIADARAGRPQRHGPAWRHLMRLCGYPEAKRCHTVDREAILARRRVNRVRVACGCPEGVLLGPRQALRLLEGVEYRCRGCRQRIRRPSQ